ncbi:MAG TPA: heme utilization cystosolic carrier protein HutX [Hyphomicrobium zavarzinii]|jgi:putative heme utilization carrier protein HutX|uniref:heme utilization cystosolic carrier protein HutX n=1 Tax=Hyphomicrobium sp. DMF-1 TaxID=3019544 RepID=UPI0022EC0783|nr:heme utilization cystosolic carrier protein HutX [Hyphomicrobium sp. DMF-1]WBT37182.1 heme utilization cystosolic carrier protein HutX [Hyphomicrobium sp. DMF-1]HML41462.1 heme utilization cystosolic carrier protein HutX [Hyphomicrobium zavarzinii]
MNAVAEQKDDVFLPLQQRLATNPDGILEDIARTYCVSTLDVVRALPEAHRTIVAGDRFETIFEAVTGWGSILFIVHTPDLVLECEGPLPPGTFGRGYFNLHGDSPIGGHIRASRCKEIAFVSRPFMGRESRSIQFFNLDGDAMFKIFVRRDEARNLIADQVARFDTLRASL